MANRKWIEDWYLQYLSEINAKKAADEEKAKTTTHPPEGGDNTKVKPDNAVPWQEANTKLPYGLGAVSRLTKMAMHKSGSNYTGDTQAVINAVAKYGPSALNKSGKKYGWGGQTDPIVEMGYVARLANAVKNLPTTNDEWKTASSNSNPLAVSMGDDSSFGGLIEDEDGAWAHDFD